MTTSLSRRLMRLEGISLTLWMRGMAATIANEQGLDPWDVLQETRVILRQLQSAGIPLTAAAVTAFLGPTRSGGTS